MVLTFSIEYQTRWGEEIRVCGTPAELGSNIPANALLLHTTDGVHWQGSIPVTHTGEITYYYLLTRDGVPFREEWNLFPRMLWLPETAEKNFYLYDSWKEQP
ncbi:MAG: 4-alpha-glucanotransferase, partial [Bacteroides sp.]|nr:4-alpha-glucanotransferase [Bacteroides sp.]